MSKSRIFPVAVFVLMFFVSGLLHGQSIKGKNFINLGIGISDVREGNLLIANYEHGLSDKISAGITFGYSGVNSFFVNEVHSISGIRVSYHLNEALRINGKRLDVYSGASIFYRYNKVDYVDISSGNYYSSSKRSVGFAIHAGGHFYISKKVGVFGELGYGISTIQFGLAFKF